MVEEAEPVLNEVDLTSEDEDCAMVAVLERLPASVDVPVLAALILETADDPDDPLP